MYLDKSWFNRNNFNQMAVDKYEKCEYRLVVYDCIEVGVDEHTISYRYVYYVYQLYLIW